MFELVSIVISELGISVIHIFKVQFTLVDKLVVQIHIYSCLIFTAYRKNLSPMMNAILKNCINVHYSVHIFIINWWDLFLVKLFTR